MEIKIRGIEEHDIETCGRIYFQAFETISNHHRFPSNFASLEAARNRISAFAHHPSVSSIVAEMNGVVAGCNFLIQLDDIHAIGPIVIDPLAQGRGVGRALMLAALDRAQGARGVRLVQESFNMQSLSLYTKGASS